MKRGLNNLIGYRIETKDGFKGSVKDFLFDEENWVVRYLVADLGFILPGKKVLIPSFFLQQPDWRNQHFPINLTKTDLKSCPPLESEPTVSREYEALLNRHYKIEDYWSLPYGTPPLSGNTIMFPKRPLKIPTKVVSEKNIETKVRSFNEVKGYRIDAINGKIGQIDDLMVDDLDWQIVYVLMDTKNWVPWSKKILVGTHWMEEISYVSEELKIKQDIETLKSAPEFDYSEPITSKYEKELFNYYESSAIEH